MSEQIKTMVIESHLRRKLKGSVTGFEIGWGNGYVGVPEGHPWFGKGIDEIVCEVHCGLTWAEKNLPCLAPDGHWWIGFDTAHSGDTLEAWPKERVEQETQKLADQAREAAL